MSPCTCTVFAICQVGSDMASLKGKGQLPFHSNLQWALAMAMAAFHCFSGPFSDLLLSVLKELFLHVRRTPQQNSQ